MPISPLLIFTVAELPSKISSQTAQSVSKTLVAKRRRKSTTIASERTKSSRSSRRRYAPSCLSSRASVDLLTYCTGQHSSGNKKAEEDAGKDADEQVKEIKSAGQKSGDKVIDDLLRVVTDVKPEVPDRVAAPPKA